jgi:hypothetical protein
MALAITTMRGAPAIFRRVHRAVLRQWRRWELRLFRGMRLYSVFERNGRRFASRKRVKQEALGVREAITVEPEAALIIFRCGRVG